MADHSRATSHEFCGSFGFGSVCKVCKSFVSILSPKKTHHKPKSNILQDNHHKVSVKKSSVDEDIDDDEQFTYKLNEGLNRKHQSNEQYYYTSSPKSSPPHSRSTSPSRLSRTISRIFRATSVKNHNHNGGGGGGGSGPALASTLSRNASSHVDLTSHHAASKSFSRSVSLRNGGAEAPASAASTTLPASFSRNASRKSSTPIMFSSSTGLVKPPPTEKTLECTLDELCFGCVKKMKVTMTDNGLTEEEEVLTIKVKPGWTKGTKITFEGKGNERLGTSAADVIFVIAEKKHPLFKRDGDNVELAVEIPLVKALTGCTISIPLLGGEKMSLTIDDIICPGYEKIIEGQGMPKPKEEGNRGNLIVTFLVAFPTEIAEEQRSDIVRILQDC
ncbi:hypothetical protein KY290_028263 [Solanum tuberosum]|uniref:Chaperone DnaJ C-terminal domain-containing protein n=1 Tax=Solanum tuberosum TaxID=4113 RepID=A0ABQ7UJ99_SOLTU|nr:hypothetical protein KY290_028263 [Solanum tuberosum]